MAALSELHAIHHDRAFTNCTLWDTWLPHATLWSSQKKRSQYRAAFLNRRIDAEGYVSKQHRGMAHSEGWPFPAWQQSTGSGWHFSTLHEVWAIQNFKLTALANTDGWEITGAEVQGIDPIWGLRLKATGDVVSITTAAFRCGTIVAPFARLEWAARGLSAESKPKIEWLLEGEAEWKPERHASFPPLRDDDGLQYTNVPLYRQPGYAGLLTRYRITIDRAAGSRIDLKSVITAIDTRHPTTNALFLRGCSEFFLWTHDLASLEKYLSDLVVAKVAKTFGIAALPKLLASFATTIIDRAMLRVPFRQHHSHEKGSAFRDRRISSATKQARAGALGEARWPQRAGGGCGRHEVAEGQGAYFAHHRDACLRLDQFLAAAA